MKSICAHHNASPVGNGEDMGVDVRGRSWPKRAKPLPQTLEALPAARGGPRWLAGQCCGARL